MTDFAQAIEQQPVVTLTATTALLGAAWGGILGAGIGNFFGKKKSSTKNGAIAGAAIGTVLFGSVGFQQGQELQQWLQRY